MPELCRFYGIIIQMFYDDHAPPHFHAKYAGKKISINIRDLSIQKGSLPGRALGLVMEWASQHQDELMTAWEKAVKREELDKIAPLP